MYIIFITIVIIDPLQDKLYVTQIPSTVFHRIFSHARNQKKKLAYNKTVFAELYGYKIM